MNIKATFKQSRETVGTPRALDSPASPIRPVHWQGQSQLHTYTDEGGPWK